MRADGKIIMVSLALPIRRLFPVLAGAVVLSSALTAGGALYSWQHADAAKDELKNVNTAMGVVSELQASGLRTALYSVTAQYVPGLAESVGKQLTDEVGVTSGIIKTLQASNCRAAPRRTSSRGRRLHRHR